MAEGAKSDKCLIPGYESIDSFAQNAFTTIVSALKAGNGLPKHGDDFDFYSSFDGFRKFCQQNGEHSLQIIRHMIGNQQMTNALMKSSLGLDIEDKMEALIDANDCSLEKVGTLLDEASGTKKKPAALEIKTNPHTADVSIASWNKKNTGSSKHTQSFHMIYAKNTARPQLQFEEKVDNSNIPFRPIIKYKPNALRPLETDEGLKYQTVQDFIAQQRQEVETGIPAESAPHPYQFEIDSCELLDSHLEVEEDLKFQPLDQTPLSFISTKDELVKLSEILQKQNKFGVDLEHHSYRSFQGFTCLMQISTKDHDYMIDTLDLRSELHILNESFTDPKIVKVFHGAVMDIEWLQRDLGVYVVNLFDTGEASKLLGLARNSLAHLLKHYCNVETDKKYQLADWRIRPLPKAMQQYAREDTHYLLYIYNKMKQDLISQGNSQKNLLKAVYQRSKTVALRKYNKPLFTSVSYLALLKKNRKMLNAKQIHAFRLLYAWRDSIAREEDESTGYVLPNHMLFQITEHLPREPSGVLACCNPIPPLLMQHLTEVHRLIVQSRNYHGKPEISGRAVTEETKATHEEVTFASRVIDPLESILHCPHDLTPSEHSHDHHIDLTRQKSDIKMAEPKVELYGSSSSKNSKLSLANKEKVVRIMSSMLNPFEMYLPAKMVSSTSEEKKPSQVESDLLVADKITLGDVSSPSPIKSSPYVWKLKQKKPEQVKPSEDDTAKPPETVPKPVDVSSDSEEAVPLKAMKRKQQSSSEKEVRSKKNKAIADKIPNIAASEPFEAYDYSQHQHKRFDDRSKEGDTSRGGGRGGRKRYFRAPSRSNVHPRSGQKSMSFSQSGRTSGSKGRQSWPNR